MFLIGAPGVGKTITSEMIAMYFASNDYDVRYTTDVINLSEIKKALSDNRERKEFILLDDCLGQCYFNLKETQDKELLSLINQVRYSDNKILLLNSRVTIFNEAKYKSEDFVTAVEDKKFKICVLDMTEISNIDKAKILYNHLYFNNLPSNYFNSIKQDKNYLNIIKHKNYCPRIIEFISKKVHYKNIKAENYYKYIMSCLDDPKKIWEDEYNNRLQPVDRILLNTLYSLTENTIEDSILEQCFNHRISLNIDEVTDTSVNNYRLCLNRLNKSFIHIVDEKGKKKVGVLNPSVNDFLRNYINSNQPEKDKIKHSIITIEQTIKLYNKNSAEHLKNKILSHEIDNYIFRNEVIKGKYIFGSLILDKICDPYYQAYVNRYFNYYYLNNFDYHRINSGYMLDIILSDAFNDCYDTRDNITTNFIKILLDSTILENQVEIINIFTDRIFDFNIQREEFCKLCYKCLTDAVDWETNDVDADDWVDELDLSDYVDEDSYDGFSMERDIEDKVEDTIYDNISKLPDDIYALIKDYKPNIYVSNCDNILSEYVSDNYDYREYNTGGGINYSEEREIDSIFDR